MIQVANAERVVDRKLKPLSAVHEHLEYCRLTFRTRTAGSHCGEADFCLLC